MFVVNEVDSIKDGDKLMKKYGKLLKTRKLFKFQKLAKLGKKILKSRNSLNFDNKKNEPSFLILKVRVTFNCLWLVFTKAPIL